MHVRFLMPQINPQYASDFLGSAEINLDSYECYNINIHSHVKTRQLVCLLSLLAVFNGEFTISFTVCLSVLYYCAR